MSELNGIVDLVLIVSFIVIAISLATTARYAPMPLWPWLGCIAATIGALASVARLLA